MANDVGLGVRASKVIVYMFFVVVLTVAGLEWPVNLKISDNSGEGPNGGGNGDDETGGAEDLEADPFGAPLGNLFLNDVHFDGEVNGEGPESEGAEDANDVIEEGEEHGDDGGENHEKGAPDEAEKVCGYEVGIWEFLFGGFLDEGEEGLAVDLVGADEVDDDGGVGDVEEPEGVVEAEAG
nr:homeobox-DDT domain protein RLT1 [Ipomoea batatas]